MEDMATTVMASGTFDILHMGHVHYLKEAKKLGDHLTVVVASDNTVRKLKHQPINPQHIRVQLISELKAVDTALLGSDTQDIYTILKDIKPDIIALGYDQIHQEETLTTELEKRGYPDIKIVRLSEYQAGNDLDGTRRIIQKIIAAHDFQKKMEQIEGH